ncbi:MAG: hypothetical protein ACK47B_01965 [Armatimonadota bacterium]
MRDFFQYVRLSAGVVVRNDAWLMVLPIAFLYVVGLWTLYFVETSKWDPGIAVTQAEVFAPLVAVFIFAGLLDAEQRRGAGEIVFSKPHPPALLLGVRVVLALLVSELFLLSVLIAYHFRFGNAAIGPSMLYAIPPCLFMGLIALTTGRSVRSAAAGYGLSLGFWLWDSTAGMLYNPLFVLPAAEIDSPEITGASPAVFLAANKLAMLTVAAALFWLNTRALRRSGF